MAKTMPLNYHFHQLLSICFLVLQDMQVHQVQTQYNSSFRHPWQSLVASHVGQTDVMAMLFLLLYSEHIQDRHSHSLHA